MRMADLVGRYAAAISPDCLHDMARLVARDRLQGSEALDNLADEVAAAAEDAGLSVQLVRYKPGIDRWWNFTAPQARSPRVGAIRITGNIRPLTSYPATACSLARGSASTAPEGVQAPVVELSNQPLWAGALVVCPPVRRFGLDTLISALAAGGALGIAVESGPRDGCDDTLVERLEVPDDCPLVAFSVSTAQAEQLRVAGSAGSTVTVTATHRRPAPMPLVYARTRTTRPGRSALLLAHLCHPAPGADDNASGVAALLGISQAAQHAYPHGDGPDLRFLWAPEMVGTAAFLHDMPGEHPDFALSVDMIAGDPVRCGGILNIEQSPDHLPSPVAAALEAAARVVRPSARSYSGAVGLPTWPRAVVPFVGASDHLLFADRSIGIPAGHITRWPNRFHHSSQDTPETLCRQELHSNAVLIAAATTALCMGGPALADVTDAMHDLARDRLARSVPAAPADATARSALRTAHAAVDGAYRTLHLWHPDDVPDIDARWTALAALADRIDQGCGPYQDHPEVEPALLRHWPGPFNLHTFNQALDPDGRRRLGALLGAGRPDYARLVAVAMAIDDQRGAADITSAAAASSALDIDTAFTQQTLDLMTEIGWVSRQR